MVFTPRPLFQMHTTTPSTHPMHALSGTPQRQEEGAHLLRRHELLCWAAIPSGAKDGGKIVKRPWGPD